jgi:hypothetical protein
MANKTIAVPYVSEGTIQIVTNNNRFALDVVCESPPYQVVKDVETMMPDLIVKKERVLEERRDTQQIGTIEAYTSEALKAEITEDGKCTWRILR